MTIFQVSRIPGYHQRLKAMLFKANFAEKVEEVKEVCLCEIIDNLLIYLDYLHELA